MLDLTEFAFSVVVRMLTGPNVQSQNATLEPQTVVPEAPEVRLDGVELVVTLPAGCVRAIRVRLGYAVGVRWQLSVSGTRRLVTHV